MDAFIDVPGIGHVRITARRMHSAAGQRTTSGRRKVRSWRMNRDNSVEIITVK